ncbi:uncharacterized protein LOC128201810 [Galleria mellonella]|uniref:Uncharacterized protein LOC128201810 n=1 Tax=Galleria mellonella TaxID=7137 RepID=A0ABM3MWU4_GALME|nr:uncharacterized protein LOC128201810 [Galleria mellonella]
MSLRKSCARRILLEKWDERLADPGAGLRTVEAVRPVLKHWLSGRRKGPLTFRLTQILTGHGCFGQYLCQIARREPTTECHECGCDRDTAQHVLEECPAFSAERRVLVAEVGGDLSLPNIVRRMVSSERSWNVILTFCEAVMSQKEAAERERESAPTAPVMRRRRARRRRRGAPNSASSFPPIRVGVLP